MENNPIVQPDLKPIQDSLRKEVRINHFFSFSYGLQALIFLLWLIASFGAWNFFQSGSYRNPTVMVLEIVLYPSCWLVALGCFIGEVIEERRVDPQAGYRFFAFMGLTMAMPFFLLVLFSDYSLPFSAHIIPLVSSLLLFLEFAVQLFGSFHDKPQRNFLLASLGLGWTALFGLTVMFVVAYVTSAQGEVTVPLFTHSPLAFCSFSPECLLFLSMIFYGLIFALQAQAAYSFRPFFPYYRVSFDNILDAPHFAANQQAMMVYLRRQQDEAFNSYGGLASEMSYQHLKTFENSLRQLLGPEAYSRLNSFEACTLACGLRDFSLAIQSEDAVDQFGPFIFSVANTLESYNRRCVATPLKNNLQDYCLSKKIPFPVDPKTSRPYRQPIGITPFEYIGFCEDAINRRTKSNINPPRPWNLANQILVAQRFDSKKPHDEWNFGSSGRLFDVTKGYYQRSLDDPRAIDDETIRFLTNLADSIAGKPLPDVPFATRLQRFSDYGPIFDYLKNFRNTNEHGVVVVDPSRGPELYAFLFGPDHFLRDYLLFLPPSSHAVAQAKEQLNSGW